MRKCIIRLLQWEVGVGDVELGVARQLFEVRCVIPGVDSVRYDPRSADVILRAGEDIGPASYESRRTSTLLVGQIIR